MPDKLPIRLPVRFLEKVWGTPDLLPWYPPSDQKIGEVWFEAELPLLVKFLFTSERLSVQVHPNDNFAGAHENSRGKTEMWYIMRADPGARLALGFRESISRERLREAAHQRRARTVVKLGGRSSGRCILRTRPALFTLSEADSRCARSSSNSDVTYRLYDLRPSRVNLHLDKAIQVAFTEASHLR